MGHHETHRPYILDKLSFSAVCDDSGKGREDSLFLLYKLSISQPMSIQACTCALTDVTC